MTFRTTGVALLLATLPAVGCGTVANLTRPGPEAGGKTPFGGVRHDMGHIRGAADGGFDAGSDQTLTSGEFRQTAEVVLYSADLPLSLIGDVVTWPYTAAYTFINQPVPLPPIIIAPPVAPSVSVTVTPPEVTLPEVAPPELTPPTSLPDADPSGR